MLIKNLIYRKGGNPRNNSRLLLKNESYDYSGANPNEVKIERSVDPPVDVEVDTDDAITIENKDTTDQSIMDPIEDVYTFLSAFKITEKSPGIINGITNETKKIVDLISAGVGSEVVLTSGRRSKKVNSGLVGNAVNSFHLEGRAVDIRTTPESDAYLSTEAARKELAAQGYEIVDERNMYTKSGKRIPPHWHIEPMPVPSAKYGGLIYKR